LAAFLAGVVVSESDLSHQVAAEALPFGHAFAVLFFVSVGMLFDPTVLVRAPGQIAVLLLLIVLGKALFAGLPVLALAYPPRTALIVAASLSQIGEFSFIVAELGLALRLLPEDGYGLIIAGALLSIIIHPLVFRALGLLEAWLSRWQGLWTLADGRAAKLASLPEKSAEGQMRGHAVLCGYGRVGSLIAAALERRGFPYVVIEQNRQIVEALRRRGIPALYGDAANPLLLERVHRPQARLLVSPSRIRSPRARSLTSPDGSTPSFPSWPAPIAPPNGHTCRPKEWTRWFLANRSWPWRWPATPCAGSE